MASMSAIDLYDIVDSKLPEDNSAAMEVLQELMDLLEERYDELSKHPA